MNIYESQVEREVKALWNSHFRNSSCVTQYSSREQSATLRRLFMHSSERVKRELILIGRYEHTTVYVLTPFSTTENINVWRTQLVMANRSLLAERTAFLVFCLQCWSAAIESNLLRGRSFKCNAAVFQSVKLSFAITLWARHHKKGMNELKSIPSACVSGPLPDTKRNWSDKVAATIPCLSDSAQRTRSVLLVLDGPETVEITDSLASKLTAVWRKLISPATYYKDSKYIAHWSCNKACML